MKFTVEYTQTAVKQLKKMDRRIAALLVSFIESKLLHCEDPRAFGAPLRGDLKDKWRYRIGNYRILAKIDDDLITIIVVELGHRRDIYVRAQR